MISLWSVSSIKIENAEYNYSRYSLIVKPQSIISVYIELNAVFNHEFSGGLFVLHGGNSGTELGEFIFNYPNTEIKENETATFEFNFKIMDFSEDFYDLTFYPISSNQDSLKAHKLKLVIFGVGHKYPTRKIPTLQITNHTFKRIPN